MRSDEALTVTLTPKGFMKEYTDAYGKVTSVHAYNGESIEEVRRTEDTTLWSLRYMFYPAGNHTDRIQYALLRKSTDGGSSWTDTQIQELIEQVEAKLDELSAENESVQRLQTIPGVGPRLSELLVAVID
ncbi:MAG: hypothetical protein AAGB26_14460, partial [Planctomycetota bacterium]